MGQHSAVSRLGGRGWALLAATMLLAAAPGCVTTATSLMHPFRAPDTVPVNDVLVTWNNHIHTVPDCVNQGRPLPGLVGQVYLVNSLTKQMLEARGNILVDVFDASDPTPGAEPVWLYHNAFDPAALMQLKGKDRYGSPCYTLFLPWPENKAVPAKVRMNLAYSADKRYAIYAEPATINLRGESSFQQVEVRSREVMPPGAVLQPAAKGTPPSANKTQVTYGPVGNALEQMINRQGAAPAATSTAATQQPLQVPPSQLPPPTQQQMMQMQQQMQQMQQSQPQNNNR
jgi:hypothetical protein